MEPKTVGELLTFLANVDPSLELWAEDLFGIQAPVTGFDVILEEGKLGDRGTPAAICLTTM